MNNNMQQPGQVDWQGLYNWSMQYQDGTRPSAPDVQPMSKDDKDWLEAAMKEYTFNDSDRLKDIADELKKDLESGFTTLIDQPPSQGVNINYDKTVDLLEELQELTEIHERNNLNLALCGGLHSILQFMLKHPDATVRRVASATFSACVQNNQEVQKFALRYGALNLMHKFMEEKESKNKEATLGALSSFLRAKNFEGKRDFVGKMGGLQFLAALILDTKQSLRLHKKAIILLYDLVLNDENIISENPTQVRKTVGEQMEILKRLMNMLLEGSLDLENGQYWDVRETILRILFRVFQVCSKEYNQFKQLIVAHKQMLEGKLSATSDDQKDLLEKEIELSARVISAPTLPIEKNFTETESKLKDKPIAIGM